MFKQKSFRGHFISNKMLVMVHLFAIYLKYHCLPQVYSLPYTKNLYI